MDDIRTRFASAVYREHALRRILERGINPATIKEAVQSADSEIIESYPNDPRGPSCLILGWWDDHRPLHVIVGLREPLLVISAYDPSADPRERWAADFKSRRSKEREEEW